MDIAWKVYYKKKTDLDLILRTVTNWFTILSYNGYFSIISSWTLLSIPVLDLAKTTNKTQ